MPTSVDNLRTFIQYWYQLTAAAAALSWESLSKTQKGIFTQTK
jgi:hypothetical protein